MAVVVETFSHDKCHRLYSSFVSIYIPPVEFCLFLFYIFRFLYYYSVFRCFATIFSRVRTVLRSHVSSYRDKHPQKEFLASCESYNATKHRENRPIRVYIYSRSELNKKRIQRGVYITKRAEGVHITSWDDPIR